MFCHQFVSLYQIQVNATMQFIHSPICYTKESTTQYTVVNKMYLNLKTEKSVEDIDLK